MSTLDATVKMFEDPGRVEAVARCLAKLDGKHVGASEWAGGVGALYRGRAAMVLLTVERYDGGLRSGGLPSGRPDRDLRP